MMESERARKIKKADLKPALILALITAITSVILVVMERAIQADEAALSGNLKEKCVELMGEGEFEVVLDWLEAGYKTERPPGVAKLIINKDNNTVAFQIIVKGYNKDGLDTLIVMNEDGSVKDLAVVKNAETPQIGTKVNERGFLENFIGGRGEFRVVKGSPRNNGEIAAITGATMSSRGVADAVNLALVAYSELFGG